MEESSLDHDTALILASIYQSGSNTGRAGVAEIEIDSVMQHVDKSDHSSNQHVSSQSKHPSSNSTQESTQPHSLQPVQLSANNQQVNSAHVFCDPKILQPFVDALNRPHDVIVWRLSPHCVQLARVIVDFMTTFNRYKTLNQSFDQSACFKKNQIINLYSILYSHQHVDNQFLSSFAYLVLTFLTGKVLCLLDEVGPHVNVTHIMQRMNAYIETSKQQIDPPLAPSVCARYVHVYLVIRRLQPTSDQYDTLDQFAACRMFATGMNTSLYARCTTETFNVLIWLPN